MDLELRGKIALLVGGGGTIGQAIAQRLSAEGAIPVIADIPANLSDRVGELKVAIDVTDETSVRNCVRQVVDRYGRIDILVELAAIYQGKPILETTADDWDCVLDINLKGTFLVCREVLPVMQHGDYGRILCFASLAGQVGGLVAGSNYAASKAGVLSFVKSLAKQSRNPGITVNAICPGPVVGTMTGAWSDEIKAAMLAKVPVGRFAQPEEIADIVVFLSSPRAGYIHGAHIDINGGAHMC